MGTWQSPSSCGGSRDWPGLSSMCSRARHGFLLTPRDVLPLPSKMPRKLKNGSSTTPDVKKSAKCLSPKRVVLSALLQRTVLFLSETASLALCARRASCAPGLGALSLLWGSLWSPTGATLLRGALGTAPAVPALPVLGSVPAVGRPGDLLSLHRSSQ